MKRRKSCTSSKNETNSTFSWLKSTKIPSQNLVDRLFQREIHLYMNKHYYSTRRFYQNITPNFTITNVQKPPCFLRKFTPDGQNLIAFSSDQTSLEIYSYKGAAAANDLLKDCNDEEILQDNELKVTVERNIFDRFFKLKHTVNVAQNGEQLNRECSLFTDDGKYVIVGSASNRPNQDVDDTYRTNESVTPNPRSPLDNYTLHIVDIELGIQMDFRTFFHDKIFLSHNQGLYLYRRILAVLSVQHQTIRIFEITPEGIFIDVRTIGRTCFEDDEYVLSSSFHPKFLHTSGPSNYAEGEKIIYSLKHRLLAFLYRYAVCTSDRQGTPKATLEFYRSFDYFYNLRIWKMQLLDESHLLIKYASEEVVTLRASEPNGQPSLFVVYNMITTEVVAVYENTSAELLNLVEQLSDFFRNARLSCESYYTCSPSNNYWARLIHERHKATIISAKGSSAQEATKRQLGQLPISSQSYSASPYLDLDLFSYDDKWVSVMERPKNCADHPIRFYGRDSGMLKFSIHAERSTHTSGLNSSTRRLVAFTFHPSDPFTISVQKANDEYLVSFHIRHVTM